MSPLSGLLLGALAPAAHATTCTAYAEPELLGVCPCEDLDESSGIAWSRTRPGVWFSHNDAGGLPQLQAFTLDGEQVDSHIVSGAGFRDWEDLAAGPCPPDTGHSRCLYIGDIGDNSRERDTVEVYAVAEPEEGENVVVLATWSLTWPGGSEDSEALAVHPCTGRIYLFSKAEDGDQPRVARAPAEPTGPDDPAELEVLVSIDVDALATAPRLTGADWAPDGDRLVIRNYNLALEWVTDPEDPDAHWDTLPVPVVLDKEGQGESIAYHPDGGLITTTERVPMRISYVACAASEEAEACPGEPDDTGDEGGGDDGGDDDGSTSDDGADDGTGADDGDDGDDGDVSDDSGRGDGGELVDGADTDEGCGCGGGAGAAWLLLLPLIRRRRRS